MKRHLFWLTLAILLFIGCQKSENNPSGKKYADFNDLKNGTVGIYEGTVHDQFLAQNYPSISIKRYNTPADMIISLKTGKVDAIMLDAITGGLLVKSNPGITLLTDDVLSLPLGVGFNKKNPELLAEFNMYLKKIKDNGLYDQIYKRWCLEDPETAIMPKINNLSSGKLIKLGVAVADFPYVAYQNGEYVGFDIELIQNFAKDRNYKLEITTMEFGSLVNALASGKVDMISDGIAITQERQKQINFSDEYMVFKTGVFVLEKNYAGDLASHSLDMNHIAEKTIGVYEGTIHENYIMENYPKAEIKRFTGTADLIIALKTKKIDAIMVDEFYGKSVVKQNPEMDFLAQNIFSQDMGIGFNKNNQVLLDEFNKFLHQIKSDGTYDNIYQRWTESETENIQVPDITLNSNGKLLRAGISICGLPYSTYINEKLTGFDVEILQLFAKQYHYNLKIDVMEFTSLLAGLASGKVDLVAAGITITDERSKQVNFSDSYIQDRACIIILKQNKLEKETTPLKVSGLKNFINQVKESFYNNIIFEKRYQLIIDGLLVTLLISFFSVILGTVFGAIICFLRMSKNKISQGFAKIYISALRGTPVLVFLMITYYIVFASVNINPIYVAIFAFGLNFAAYVSEMFRTGIEGIDKGQSEAGIAMGFNKIQTFILIIMPQAAKSILPVYKGEVISLVKMTSIVGYIAVEDLTKAGDIIRSRTFDAFFPLIMIAVLYFLISWVLILLLDFFQKKTEPKSRRKTA